MNSYFVVVEINHLKWLKFEIEAIKFFATSFLTSNSNKKKE